jgi:inorganic pyrophosphatase
VSHQTQNLGSLSGFPLDGGRQLFNRRIHTVQQFQQLLPAKAEDGDPTDVLVLTDEPAFPGCVLECRLIGVIEGEQGTGKKTERNDRVIAVEVENHSWADIRHVDDLGKKFLKELEEFFVNYHQLTGKEYRVLDVKGPGAAR